MAAGMATDPNATQPQLYGMTPEEHDALTRQNAQKAYENLSKQYEVAQKGVDTAQQGLTDLATTERGALGDVQNKSALAFLAQQGRGGGGSGAAMRQSMLGRGVAEGSVRGEFSQRRTAQEQAIQDAKVRAAKAGSELATEGEKLNQAAIAYDAGATSGYEEAKAIFDTVAGDQVMFMTDADRENAIGQIQRKMDAETNPKKKKGMQQAIDDIRANRMNAKGAIDTADQSRAGWKKVLDPFGFF